MSNTDELEHAALAATMRRNLGSNLLASLTTLDGAQHALGELMYGGARLPEFDRPDAHDAHDEMVIALRAARNVLRALAPLLPANAEPYPNPITDKETP